MTGGPDEAWTGEPEHDGPAVQLSGVRKHFPGVVANHDVNLGIYPGTVHAVIGENGAGKSTLMKILYGIQRPDSGTITINDEIVTIRTPTDAIGHGIGMVFQHFMLADNLTVLENLVLGSEELHGIGDAARAELMGISEQFGFELDPDTFVADLGVAARQRLEIAKVLYRGAQIIILDEPTAVLVPQEVENLFANLRKLRDAGTCVVFISHKLDEVLAIADDITVMRRGTTVGTADPGSVTRTELAELMVGSELPTPHRAESDVTDIAQLSVDSVRVINEENRRLLDDVSLEIRRGEIMGIAGVEGNGQTELVETIMGLRIPSQGTIYLGDVDVTKWHTRKLRHAGIGYIPEDRHRHGLLLDSPLWENRILGHQTKPPSMRGRWINRSGAKADTRRVVEQYDVRTPSIGALARALSGGNQQKLVVGRELTGDPVVLLASHPTRGVDVGAQAAIWEHIRRARSAGLAVLLISADLDELIGLSDVIDVILRGAIVGRFDPSTITPQQLGSAMTGGELAQGSTGD